MTGGRIRAAERLAEGGNVSAANAAAAYRAAAELRQLVDEHVLGPLVNIPPHGHVSRRCCLPPAACLHCCLPAARCLPALLPACTAACLHCCLPALLPAASVSAPTTCSPMAATTAAVASPHS